MQRMAQCINTLADFCGKRDVDALTPQALQAKYGFDKADVMVLFGGSILEGGHVLAQAIKDGAAKYYIIVGGEGHTTQTLRDKMHAAYPAVETAGLPEAQVFAQYLEKVHGLYADALECKSTNCGNNITYLLELMKEKGIACESVILTQDASMQRRMEAGLKKHAGDDLTIINFAAYRAEVTVKDGKLAFVQDIRGMWDMERYISLLLGEIPRLTDDENGYGPRGKDFIAHVDIPDEVKAAFAELTARYAHLVREANPAYASKQ